MDFEKKIWVDVPDPSQFTEQQLSELPRLDADNMNRIEEGVGAALRRDGGTMAGDIYKTDSRKESNRYITREHVDNLIAYLNSSPLTFKRGDSGAIVSKTTAVGTGKSEIFSVLVDKNTLYSAPISLENIFSFNFERPEYEVPFITGEITGALDGRTNTAGGYLINENYLSNTYYVIKDLEGNEVLTASVTNPSSAYHLRECTFDISSLQNGRYTIDFHTTITIDRSGNSTARAFSNGLTISFSFSHHDRDIITFIE